MRKLHQLGCVCCHMQGRYSEPCQIHHLVYNGYRRLSGGHKSTIGLCGWHHVGLPPDGMTMLQARKVMGPSLAHGSKTFARVFGMQMELLDTVDRLIGEIV